MTPVNDMIQELANSVIPKPVHAARAESARARDARDHDPGIARGDAVELSDAARDHAESTPIRQERVDQVRAEIRSGTYLTDEKMEIAAERLLHDLQS